MGTKLVAHRMFAQQVIAGADSVVAGVYLPANTMFHGVAGHCTFEAAVERGLNEVALGALAGYILPLPDPDSSGTLSAQWDALVPKDSNSDDLDLDTGAGDATPFWEPGFTKWEEVFDVGYQVRSLYNKHFMASMGQNAIAVNRDPATPFDYEYIGGKTMRVGVRGDLFIPGPSVCIFAAGSPLTTGTSATAPLAAIAEADWAQLQYIDEVMERAYLHVLGLVEAGAETPFEEATALLQLHLDAQVLEVAGGIFQPTTWNLSGEFRFDYEVQGRLPRGNVIDLGA